jgi:hypothetical protein
LFLVLVHVLVLVLEIPAREDWAPADFLRVVGRQGIHRAEPKTDPHAHEGDEREAEHA